MKKVEVKMLSKEEAITTTLAINRPSLSVVVAMCWMYQLVYSI